MKITRIQLRKIIQEAIRQNEPGYNISLKPDTKRISYTALVLDDASHNALLQYVPEGWRVYAHHMTLIAPGNQSGVRLPERYLEQPASIVATGIVADDRVIAAVIDLSQSDSILPMSGPIFPHVTIATNPLTKGKPHMSNQLDPDPYGENFSPIAPIKLSGIIKEIAR